MAKTEQLPAVQHARRTRFIFAGCSGSEPEQGSQLNQSEETKHDFDLANALFLLLCLALGIK